MKNSKAFNFIKELITGNYSGYYLIGGMDDALYLFGEDFNFQQSFDLK